MPNWIGQVISNGFLFICLRYLRMKIILLGITLVVVALAGCAGVPRGNWIGVNVPSDAGPRPENYEQTALNYLKSRLKDPYSMRDFAVFQPVLASCAIGIYGPFYGWRGAMQYNAKNSYGAYVGLQNSYLWFHGERLVGISDSPDFCPSIKAGV